MIVDNQTVRISKVYNYHKMEAKRSIDALSSDFFFVNIYIHCKIIPIDYMILKEIHSLRRIPNT